MDYPAVGHTLCCFVVFFYEAICFMSYLVLNILLFSVFLYPASK